jgi:hypothetical protein
MNQDDYGLCVPGCTLCGGVGYIGYNVDVHNENFGKMQQCPNRRLNHWDKTIGIEFDEAQLLDWRQFMQTPAVSLMREAFDGVLERGFGWVYVYGNPGNGKTITAKACAVIARQVKGFHTRYSKVSEMVNWLRESYDYDNGQIVYRNRLKELRKIKCLVMDEVGRDRQTDFSKTSLSDIMDSRYEDAVSEKTITVWVSNFKPEDIFEPYQFDRIRDSRFRVLEIKDVSMRPTPKDEREKSMWWHNY